MFSTVGLILEGKKEGQQSHPRDVSERTGRSYPKCFFSWSPTTLGLNCRAEKPLQEWFLLDEMEIIHAGLHAGDMDFAALGMGGQCQNMTTHPSLEPEWLLLFLY